MKKSEEQKLKVCQLILDYGFVTEGEVSGETIKSWNNDRNAPMMMYFPARLRFKLEKTDWKVTVGSRTVCFYKVIQGEVKSALNLETRKIEDIKVQLDNIVDHLH